MPLDAEIMVQETPLVHVADAITLITKSPQLPSADGRPVIHPNASSFAAPQDVVMTSMLNDLVRGPAPCIGRGYAGSWIWTSQKTSSSRYFGE
jgi:hypothetical protein